MSARIYVRRPSGAVYVFHATEATVDAGVVTARGGWKDRPDRPERKYAWAASRVLEIRWEVGS